MLTIEEIRELIKIVDESSLDEFTYETNGAKVKMKKDTQYHEGYTIYQPVQTDEKTQEQMSVETMPVQSDSKQTETGESSEKETTSDYDHEIVSPMVGTFYAAPNPESDPYVKVGSEVQSESIVCIVEAMKLFNEIEAEVTGEVVEIMVEDGELVEYGQPLFRVKTT